MATNLDLYETVNDAVQALYLAVRDHGIEPVRDALGEAYDHGDEDSTPFENALYLAIKDALTEAETVAAGDKLIVMIPTMGERITFSWQTEHLPPGTYADTVMEAVARMVRPDAAFPTDREDTDELIGHLTGPRQQRLRYRIGESCGDLFEEDDDFDGLTLTVELPSLEDGEAIVAKMDAWGVAGQWPVPVQEAFDA